MMPFQQIDHPSVLGIIAHGKTREELFENAAKELFSLITDIDKVEPKEEFKLGVYGDDPETLLATLLNELLYSFEAKKVLLKEFKVTIGHNKAVCKCKGERLDPSRHVIINLITNAPHERIQIKQDKDGYSARIVFEL